jgi:hypothetical protein
MLTTVSALFLGCFIGPHSQQFNLESTVNQYNVNRDAYELACHPWKVAAQQQPCKDWDAALTSALNDIVEGAKANANVGGNVQPFLDKITQDFKMAATAQAAVTKAGGQ